MDGIGRVEAALGYYRQTLQPELQDPALADAQNAAYSLPPQPLLYLHGRDDGCMRIEVAETSGTVMDVPGSRAVMVDDAGHFLQLERPDVVNAEILAFLAE
jgi:pimeloyl-ACP methyl ester carboxylesterase